MGTKLTLIEDAGHAWLGVPLEQLEQYGLLHQISKYSYLEWSRDGETPIAWLEEDSDLARYAQATEMAPHAFSDLVESVHVGTNAFVRKLPRYTELDARICLDDWRASQRGAQA